MNLPISALTSTMPHVSSTHPEPAQNQASRLSPADQAKLKSTCQDFESIFFGMMLKEMRKTVPQDSLLGDDAHEQEIFQGMMDDSVAKQMATHGGSDSLATEMYRQLAGEQGAEGIESERTE